MKRLFFILLAAVYSFAAFAQTQGTRQLRAWYDGAVIWQREAALVDSLNFFIDTTTGGGNTGGNEECGEIDENAQIYVGVVAFNQAVTKLPITSTTSSAKTFITGLTNDNNNTAFAYAASQGNKMFDASCLPAFDKIFMLNFSDGTDNYSSTLWYYENRRVVQANVYDTARYDLSQRVDLNSYAIGFGDDVGFGTKMQKVVLGSGTYKNATTSADLQTTFNEVAQSIITSARNVVLQTSPTIGTKWVRFCFTANGVKDTIYTQIDGFPDTGYTLTITKAGKYARFDTPVTGVVVDTEFGEKVQLPLNNLKFVYNGEELQNSSIASVIEVSYDDELYYVDVEDASTAESISKRIAVVLVLDCSKSMGDAFTPMKNAAIDFIETLEKMDPETEIPSNPNTPNTGSHAYVDLGLTSGTLWATCNVGAANPEDYGDYFAWGETTTKSTYDWSTYKYCNGSSSTMTKYCTSSSYGTVDNKTTLDITDDAARANWGGAWRMPTIDEQQELLNECTWSWTTLNGVYGCRVTSKKDTTKSIFLPAAGYRDGASLNNAGSYGYYWSSSLGSDFSDIACALSFYSDYYYWGINFRSCGHSVRPVCSSR